MAVSVAAVSYDRREIKRAPVALAGVSASGVFEGYASLFDTADLGRDVVAAGAFADSLRQRGPAGVKMLWQHEASEPIGTWLSIDEDARGLKVRGKLNLAVARAREILALMREGAVDGLSIGFRTRKAVTNRVTGLRTLQSVDLWEISVVTFPMHPGARVTAVKRAAPRHPEHSLAGVRSDLTRLRWRRDALAVEQGLQKWERRYSDDQPRDDQGRWAAGGGTTSSHSDSVTALAGSNDCEEQYDFDSSICRGLGSKFQRQKCWASAMDRYSACLSGRSLTPLRY